MENIEICEKCKGLGTLYERDYTGDTESKVCPNCDGAGRIHRHTISFTYKLGTSEYNISKLINAINALIRTLNN